MTLYRCLFALVSLTLSSFAHAQAGKPYVIMVGIDGLRPTSVTQNNMPNLYTLGQQGVTAKSMTPAMPTKTFVNFYSIATGLHPEHHGIVSNYPFDRQLNRKFSRNTDATDPYWWDGEPIWITAERQGLKAATYFWVGSEVDINGVRPSYRKTYNQNKDYAERVTEVLQWMSLPEAQRPHLVTLYFSSVDSAAHDFGVNSKEEQSAIKRIDQRIGELLSGLRNLPVHQDINVVVVSDHGMIDLSPERVINLNSFVNWSDFVISDWGKDTSSVFSPFLNLYGELSHVDSAYQALTMNPIAHLRVMKRPALAQKYHFNHPQRGPDLMLLADPGWSIYASQDESQPNVSTLTHTATHGYDNQAPEMAATFIANGPAFAKQTTSNRFDNIEVYNLIACALGIKPAKNDGDISNVRHILSAQKQSCLAEH